MRRHAPLVFAALMLPVPAAAQPSADAKPAAAAAVSDRMAPFAWLVGEWEGSGGMMTPDGKRHTFESRETVSTKLSGTALLVEGRHHEPGQRNKVVHDAMAMITWDVGANAYRFRSALANGRGGDYAIEPKSDGFTWKMDLPDGAITYVVIHRNGVWTERGSRTGSDGRAVDFFEMTLRRK